MTENITNQISAFFSALKTAYDQQGPLGKILLPGLVLLIFCCLCVGLISVLPSRSRDPSTAVPSPSLFPTAGGEFTPTPLFNFNFPTSTPFPTATFFVPSPFPTLTPAPTGTVTLTPLVPTATATLLPTNTATQAPPTTVRAVAIRIVDVDKRAEYVDIENLTNQPIALRGWRLVSEVGNQSCALRGTLGPNRVLRIWAQQGNPGFDCRLQDNIWRDFQPDPAVLYNPQGEEVSRFPF
jgi:hypothetical protein